MFTSVREMGMQYAF